MTKNPEKLSEIAAKIAVQNHLLGQDVDKEISAAIEADLASKSSKAENLRQCEMGLLTSFSLKKLAIDQFVTENYEKDTATYDSKQYLERAVFKLKDDLASILINKEFIEDSGGDFLYHILSHSMIQTASKTIEICKNSKDESLAKELIFDNYCKVLKCSFITRYNIDEGAFAAKIIDLAKNLNFLHELIEKSSHFFTEAVHDGLYESFNLIIDNSDDEQKKINILSVNNCIVASAIAFNNFKISQKLIKTAEDLKMNPEEYANIVECHQKLSERKRKREDRLPTSSPAPSGASAEEVKGSHKKPRTK